MKYCPYCHRWNVGRPQLCNYCGRSWYVKLCPRGHENPPDAQFCGQCGSADLTDTAGRRPIWMPLLRAIVLLLLIIFAYALVQGLLHFPARLAAFLIVPAVFLLIAYHLALGILPGAMKRPFLALNKAVLNCVLNFLKWFWEKIKLLLS